MAVSQKNKKTKNVNRISTNDCKYYYTR